MAANAAAADSPPGRRPRNGAHDDSAARRQHLGRVDTAHGFACVPQHCELRVVPNAPDPPIRFTLHVNLPADVMRHVQDIPDTLIAIERGE